MPRQRSQHAMMYGDGGNGFAWPETGTTTVSSRTTWPKLQCQVLQRPRHLVSSAPARKHKEEKTPTRKQKKETQNRSTHQQQRTKNTARETTARAPYPPDRARLRLR